MNTEHRLSKRAARSVPSIIKISLRLSEFHCLRSSRRRLGQNTRFLLKHAITHEHLSRVLATGLTTGLTTKSWSREASSRLDPAHLSESSRVIPSRIETIRRRTLSYARRKPACTAGSLGSPAETRSGLSPALTNIRSVAKSRHWVCRRGRNTT